ncbi:MAG: N-6 DNA methylase [Clostridia bacterium]|nr:N-6 DNA methylase [Clostridia bacterium]
MYEDYYKKFLEDYRYLSTRYDKYTVFLDFLKLASFSMYNAFKKSDEIEKQYLTVVSGYQKDDIKVFTKMFGNLIMMFETKGKIEDILGEIFTREGLGNSRLGQFFTPFHISNFMANVVIGEKENLEQIIEEKGYISLSEPTCGAGGMILAVAKVLKEKGINYQQKLLVHAVDISELCVYMTYVQLSLFGIPAIVYCGDSITMNMNYYLETPMYFLNSWRFENNYEEKETEENQKDNEQEKIIKFKEATVMGNCQISLW